MPLSSADRDNFEMLSKAFHVGDTALMECQLVSTGQPVAVICGVNQYDDGSREFVPLAQMFSGNPYTLINPPHPDHDGFVTQEEVWSAPK